MLRNPTRLMVSEVSNLKSTLNRNRTLRRIVAVIVLASTLLLTSMGILDKTEDTGHHEHWMELENKPGMRLFVGVF